jgi:hypothetical protein
MRRILAQVTIVSNVGLPFVSLHFLALPLIRMNMVKVNIEIEEFLSEDSPSALVHLVTHKPCTRQGERITRVTLLVIGIQWM